MTPEQREEMGRIAFEAATGIKPNDIANWSSIADLNHEKWRRAAEAVWNKAVEHLKDESEIRRRYHYARGLLTRVESAWDREAHEEGETILDAMSAVRDWLSDERMEEEIYPTVEELTVRPDSVAPTQEGE